MKPDRTTATRRQAPTIAVMKSAPELEEQIRRRAYELYEQRGREDGHELDHWLRAESEVAQKRRRQYPHRSSAYRLSCFATLLATERAEDGFMSSLCSRLSDSLPCPQGRGVGAMTAQASKRSHGRWEKAILGSF